MGGITVRDYSEAERRWLWLSLVFEHDVRRLYALLNSFDTIEELYNDCAKGHFKNTGIITQTQYQKLMRYGAPRFLDACIARLNQKNIDTVTRAAEDYPPLLENIYDPPAALYVKGRLRPDAGLPVAMVGSRRCTDYGARAARSLSKDLSCAGCCIISGLAYGIDAIAAEGALSCRESEYPAIAVLGSGVDVVYPAANMSIYYELIERGAVVSEYLPGSKPLKMHFPQRNRIISGLSRGVVVVEAGEKSGTFITVDYALDQGRDVFAVPGRITDQGSAGTNRLIRDGMAKPVFGADDILIEYGLAEKPANGAKQGQDILSLPEELSVIYQLLLSGEKSFDELCELSSYEPAALNSALTSLEFSGIIKQLPGRIYCI